MKLHCPHCGVKGSADDSYSGRKVKCPKCQGMFEVQPDMALESPEDSTLASAPISTPTESPASLGEVEITTSEKVGPEGDPADLSPLQDGSVQPATDSDLTAEEEDSAIGEEPDGDMWAEEKEEPAEIEVAGPVDPENPEQETENELAETAEPSEIVEEVEESIEVDVDLSETAQEIPPSAGEEELRWEDIASEIDLQSAEGDSEKELEEDIEGDPADASSLQDEFEEPVADSGLTAEEEDSVIEDESGEDIWAALEEHSEIKVTELTEEPAVSDSVDLENPEQENAEIAKLEEEDVSGDDVELVPEDDGIELEPYGIDKEQCWQCGKENTLGGQPFVAKDDRLYCTDCISLEDTADVVDTQQEQETGETLDAQKSVTEDLTESAADETSDKFSMWGAIRQAWVKTKGAKGTIWAGSAIMYLVILALVVGGALLLPPLNGEMTNISDVVINILLQVVTNVFSVIFTAGLLLMGVRKVAGDQISWKMIFQGFSCAGKIIAVTILQSIFVAIGFLLLVLPGIYLAVGYTMAIPLIIDKGLSPWQAMEVSRKAIHKIWWKVAGLFIVMCLIFAVSTIPLGIGLIWTWPMFIILVGVVYRYLFSGEKEVS
jgi:hypothetical protein